MYCREGRIGDGEMKLYFPPAACYICSDGALFLCTKRGHAAFMWIAYAETLSGKTLII